MGKVRVKTFDEAQEDRDKKREAQREQKKQARKTETEAVELTESTEADEIKVEEVQAEETKEPKKKVSKYKEKQAAKKSPSKRYQENKSMVGVKTAYPLKTAVEMLKKFKTPKFDETIELHINVREKGVSGTLSLPHGTGKKRIIKIADDATIAEIEKGQITFDVLVAHPSMMPKLAKVARILGPKGLMPNPKNGTVTPNTDQMVEKLSAGQMSFKTEPDAPVIHMSVGKISFDEKQINENVTAALKAVKVPNITKITLKSSMSPALYININSLGK